jgi:hypothetical protein
MMTVTEKKSRLMDHHCHRGSSTAHGGRRAYSRLVANLAMLVLLGMCFREASCSDIMDAMQRKRHGRTEAKVSGFSSLTPKVSCRWCTGQKIRVLVFSMRVCMLKELFFPCSAFFFSSCWCVCPHCKTRMCLTRDAHTMFHCGDHSVVLANASSYDTSRMYVMCVCVCLCVSFWDSCMHLCTYAHMCVSAVWECGYVCMYAYMHACMYISCIALQLLRPHIMFVCMHVCMQ